MNIVDAFNIAKKRGKKVRPKGRGCQVIEYKNGNFLKHYKTPKTPNSPFVYRCVPTEDILADWEVVEDKQNKQTQYKIDSMKFQIVRHCKNTECCNRECELYRKCVDKVRVDNGYSPKANLLDDWSLKGIVEAYHILKEAGEI